MHAKSRWLQSLSLRQWAADWSPLRRRAFRLYFGGQAVSLLGTWMQITAQSWVVWELSHSMQSQGVVALLGSLPLILLAPWAGAAADRFDRRKLLILAQVAAMLLAFALALLVQTGWIRLWHVYGLSFLLGVVAAVEMPAQQAFIGDLVGMSEVRKALALNGIIVQLGRTVGPTLAGWAIAHIGVAEAFWVNGVSFLAVIASLLAIRSVTTERASQTGISRGGFGEAVRYLRSQPRLLDLLAFTMLAAFFVLSNLTIYPALATVVLRGDSRTLGWLLGASGVGALIGSVLVTHLSRAIPRVGAALVGCTVWAGVMVVCNSWSRTLPTAVSCIVATGLAVPFIFTTANGLTQMLAPVQMRGRLLSILLMAGFGLQPVVAIGIGWIGDRFGPSQALLINGLCLIGGGLLMMGRPGLLGWQVGVATTGESAPPGVAPAQPA
ncbi:MFS transporter [Chloracidobacterium sp. D]|uniref:MFS transporter n=1 Tax=Chloracidobacterium sp. D TaxID=2821536 RepID=UPI001B8AADEE|nr:MFS transporter [Chloracidobacterium sp. D]QUV82545.1 MFS transporter [Chloracidobacterium sp. D]